eukprot:gene4424-3223_t
MSVELVDFIKNGDLSKLQEGISSGKVQQFLHTAVFEGDFPLHLATKARNEKMVKLLLEAGANVNQGSEARGSHRGYTAAHEAASNGDIDILSVLDEFHADFNRCSDDKWYPLHCAVYKGKPNAITFLLEHGADVNCETEHQQTPLCFAASHGRARDVRLLLKHNASLDLKDTNRDTLMHHALHYRMSKLFEGDYDIPEAQLDVAVILAISGVNPCAANNEQEEPTLFIHEDMPTLPKALSILYNNSPILRSIPIEWNYMSLVSSKEEILKAAGLPPAEASHLCEAMAAVEKEREESKARKLAERPQGGCPVMRGKKEKGNDAVPAGQDPSGGKCPFFQKKDATPDAETTPEVPPGHPPVPANVAGATAADPSGGKCPFFQKKNAAKPSGPEDLPPVCPFSIAFVQRHGTFLLLMGFSFMLGMWVDQMLNRLPQQRIYIYINQIESVVVTSVETHSVHLVEVVDVDSAAVVGSAVHAVVATVADVVAAAAEDPDPPEHIEVVGTFMNASEGDLVYKVVPSEVVPRFNAFVYSENKAKIGKIEEILGNTGDVMFSISYSFPPRNFPPCVCLRSLPSPEVAEGVVAVAGIVAAADSAAVAAGSVVVEAGIAAVAVTSAAVAVASVVVAVASVVVAVADIKLLSRHTCNAYTPPLNTRSDIDYLRFLVPLPRECIGVLLNSLWGIFPAVLNLYLYSFPLFSHLFWYLLFILHILHYVMARRWNTEDSPAEVLQRVQKSRSSVRLGWIIFGAILLAGFVIPRVIYLSEEVVAIVATDDILSAIGILYIVELLTLLLLYLVLETNPGYVMGQVSPRYAHRCPLCRVTVDEFDHHCGILGVCIGKGNMKYFILFLFFAATLSAVASVLGGNYLYCVAMANHIPLAFKNLPFPQFCQFFFFIFLKSFRRMLGLASFLGTIHAALACFGLFLFYLYKAVSGQYSVERRRFEVVDVTFAVFTTELSPCVHDLSRNTSGNTK